MDKISERQVNKFLSKLNHYRPTYNLGNKEGIILIDKNFYASFDKLDRDKINEILNILQARELILIYHPRNKNDALSPKNTSPYLTLTEKAAEYPLRIRNERRHFWLPIIISTAITIPGAYREELAQLGRALLKLLKLLTAN